MKKKKEGKGKKKESVLCALCPFVLLIERALTDCCKSQKWHFCFSEEQKRSLARLHIFRAKTEVQEQERLALLFTPLPNIKRKEKAKKSANIQSTQTSFSSYSLPHFLIIICITWYRQQQQQQQQQNHFHFSREN